MEVSLVVVEGRPLGAVIPVKSGRFLIGRGEDCHLRPKSPTVSQRHCVIAREGQQVTVQDLGSTNGTLVNDRCLHKGDEIVVNDGDRLQVGQLIFTIQVAAESPQTASRLEDWLMPAGETPTGDPNMGTMLLAAMPAPTRPRVLPPTERIPTPAPEASAKLRYLKREADRHVASVGLTQAAMLDDGEVGTVRNKLYDLVSRERYHHLVIDLGTVDSLTSIAVALIYGLASRCQDSGGELRVCGLRPAVKKVFGALKLDRAIPCYPDRTAAVATPWK